MSGGSKREQMRYDEVILAVFSRLIERYGQGSTRLEFDKGFLDHVANELDIKNVPDILYS